ncbi:hypothetical protein NQZ68_025482 [Dissostichus eleginoides]|nr:hypothetical protein NQZ68_025479 [Dissostichus eleginoides]KAI9523757.1 hypothetical protein NQZ68_025482 [Dissostichus eleginoides]
MAAMWQRRSPLASSAETASSTLYFLVPPLQIHTEEEGSNQHVGKAQELIGHIHCTHTCCSDQLSH